MKVLSIHVENFGSYPVFDHDFSEDGLSLVYGATGSGKSTFMDTVAWILYGVTAKDGAVDEIRSWQSPDSPTLGQAVVDTPSGHIEVTRIRGKAGQNDLYWKDCTDDDSGIEQRGKDLQDTQKLLDAVLGVSASTYLSSSYLHEFSATGNFWIASAKDRRKLFEKIAPLEFPSTLAVRASDARKDAKAHLTKVDVSLAGFEGQLKQTLELAQDAQTRSGTWETDRKAKAEAIALKAVRFETDRQMDIARLTSTAKQWQEKKKAEFDTLADELLALEAKIKDPGDFDKQIRQLMDQSRCEKCRSLPLTANAGIAKLQQEKQANSYSVKYFEQGTARLKALDKELKENPYTAQIEKVKAAQNTFKEDGARVLAEANPFTAQAEKLQRDAKALSTQIAHVKHDQTLLQGRIASLTRIYELSFELRGQMLQRAVQSIQDATNGILEKYFDAEIRVQFSLAEADTLEVEIKKSGYDCTFRQLSKGQRGLLRLSFGVAVMEAVSNQAGISTNLMFFDESLDGLDTRLKIKAFDLFQELATKHPSVYVIDHCEELQGMFDRRYRVVLNGDASEMTREG